MATNYQLTEGALRTIMNGGEFKDPIVQVLGSKKVNPGNTEKVRYRLLLSDGKNTVSHAMFTMQANDKVGLSAITENTIIRLKKFITSFVDNVGKGSTTRVLLLMDLEVVEPGALVGKVLGDVAHLNEANLNTPSSTTPQSNENVRPQNNGFAGHSVNLGNNTTIGGDSNKIISPISSLSPYHNKWIIKARVTNKSGIRTWSNSKGEGKLFSMDLMDESGEIRCTAFREFVDKYYDYVQIDKVYFISKCQLKSANKQFTTIKHDYEMTVGHETVIEECQDDTDNSVPQVKYDFSPIDKIAVMEVGTVVDVIGVCKESSDLQTFTARTTQRELKKRSVILVDQSKTSMELTLWGEQAESFDSTNNPVVVVKGARINEFGGGKSLSTLMSSQLKINPDIPECHRIKGWFDLEGHQAEITSASARTGSGNLNTPWLALRDIQAQGLGNNPKGDYYQVVGTILLMRNENSLYKACPQKDCNKKIVDLENGMYRCEKCNQEFPNFKWRLLASMNIADWSSNQWVTTFATEGEKIIGCTSQELGEKMELDAEAGARCIENAHFKRYLLKCRTKMETYNDENRLKTVVVNVNPLNYEEHNNYLIERINQLMA